MVITLTAAAAQSAPPQTGSLPQDLTPAALLREAIKNEVAATKDTPARHMFRSRKQTSRGSQTKLYVETSDAMAGMVIANNEQPLSPQQLQGELDHLAGLEHNPDQLRTKHSREKEDADRTLRMVRALPDAFLYDYETTEVAAPGTGDAGDKLVRLKFRPNPNYSPPSRVEQVLTGMRGYVLIDTAKMRIAKIDGTLFKDVSFGWGILGHLDQGGHFLVEQAELDDGAWEITHMSLNLTGKILFFKSINIVSDETLTDFRHVAPDLTFAQGVEMLKAEHARLAEEQQAKPAQQNARQATTPQR